MRAIAIAGLLLLGAACSRESAAPDGDAGTEAANGIAPAPARSETFLLSGQRYTVPSSHIRAIQREPPAFVRIKHPEVPFELVYDRRSDRALDPNGAPQIFSINDGESPRLEYHRSPRGIVVCRRASAPRGGCGIKVRHARAEWSVLFPVGRLDETERFAAEADALLDDYES